MERLLPKKMIPVFLEEAQIPEDKKIRDISKKERRHMIELMKNFEMHITGVRGFNEAIVTRGGVNVKEINPSTMESNCSGVRDAFKSRISFNSPASNSF